MNQSDQNGKPRFVSLHPHYLFQAHCRLACTGCCDFLRHFCWSRSSGYSTNAGLEIHGNFQNPLVNDRQLTVHLHLKGSRAIAAVLQRWGQVDRAQFGQHACLWKVSAPGVFRTALVKSLSLFTHRD